MNVRSGNIPSELIPSPNADGESNAVSLAPAAGGRFTEAQFNKKTSHVWLTVEAGSVTMTMDGRDPAGEGVVAHTLPEGTALTMRRRALLAMRFLGAGTVKVSQMCTG